MIYSIRRRKKRTSIDTTIRIALERAFNQNPKPTGEEIAFVSDNLNMEREVVRVWFCNRRQKEKRLNPNSAGYEEGGSGSPSPHPATSTSPGAQQLTSPPPPPFSPYTSSSGSPPPTLAHSIFGTQDRAPAPALSPGAGYAAHHAAFSPSAADTSADSFER